MLRVKLHEPKTLIWWATQRRRIDFDPPYQRRGGLWTTKDKAFLIDSIINDYDIPKLYLADFTYAPSPLNAAGTEYAVVDGKQRFESIFDFLDGHLTLLDDFVYEQDPSLRLGGLGYRDLKLNHPEVASEFDNFSLTVMSVITDEEGKINDLFVRLNRNRPLTGPEIRNAMAGIVPELIREIAQMPLFGDRAAFAMTRGQDLDVAAKFLLTEFRGRVVETKRENLDRLVAESLESGADEEDLRRAAARVRKVVDAMGEVFLTRDRLLRTQGQLVPYYLLVRATEQELHLKIRPFLLRFEDLRKANRDLASDADAADQVDRDLLRYDALNRGINDQGSIEGRFEILFDRFREYLRTGLLLARPRATAAAP
jgi:hypothetical protein